jgi:hypothetical protein
MSLRFIEQESILRDRKLLVCLCLSFSKYLFSYVSVVFQPEIVREGSNLVSCAKDRASSGLGLSLLGKTLQFSLSEALIIIVFTVALILNLIPQ